MEKQELLQKKIDLFTHAVRGDVMPERIPLFDNLWTWKIHDAGFKLSETLQSNDLMKATMKHTLDTYNFDVIYYTCQRNPIAPEKAVGVNAYIIDDENGSIAINDSCLMKADEYDELIANIDKFYWEKALPRRANGKKNTIEDFQKGFAAQRAFAKNQGEIRQMILDAGIPVSCELMTGMPGVGVEVMFNCLRGIKGTAIDMRRDFEKFAQACDIITGINFKTYKDVPNQYTGRSKVAAFDIAVVMLAHTIMNAKQFERLYYPSLKLLGEEAEQWDKTIYLFSEGSSDRFWDIYNDLPVGRFCLYTEQDDIRALKKAVPGITPGGGMSNEALGVMSPAECIEEAKKLIAEVGFDGKYVLGPSKMLSYPSDAKRENLKALCDYMQNL